MSISAADLLALARDLEAGNTECRMRASVSRAYYAAFHHASTWHQTLPSPGMLPATPGGKHHDLVGCLAAPTMPATDGRHTQSKRAAYILRDAHRLRVRADYLLTENMSATDAATAIAWSDKIIGILS